MISGSNFASRGGLVHPSGRHDRARSEPAPFADILDDLHHAGWCVGVVGLDYDRESVGGADEWH